MIIPIRCFTCNKVVADKWTRQDNTGYRDLLKQGFSEKEAMDKLGLERTCCRRMIISHVDTIKKINY